MTFTSTIGIPWAHRSWSGGGIASADPGVSVVLTADEAVGVMRVRVWWPDAEILQLARIHPDGSQHPVRGGYPVTPEPTTRRNAATNPSLETDLTGYTAGTGTPTLTRITGTMPAGSAALRATIASAGTCEVGIPHALTVDTTVTTVTIGVGLRLSDTATAVTVTVDWLDSDSIPLSASVASLSAGQITSSVDAWARQTFTVTPPVGAVTVSTIAIAATGLPSGATVDLDAVLIEQGSTDGSFFDGATQGGSWGGTAHLSTSVLGAETVVLDGECPLDVAVSYLVTDPSLTGGSVTSDSATLSSGGYRTWLTHPAQSGDPMRVELRAVPTLDREIDQGVFWPVGARYPLVVSGAQRRAIATTVDFVALSFDERDALLDYFADGQPLLLRAPSDFGRGLGYWLAFGTVTEDAEDRKAFQDAFLLSGECVEVDAPVAGDAILPAVVVSTPTALDHYVITFDEDVSRWDSTDSTLNSGVTSSATSLSVAFTTTRWTTSAGQMPIPITVGGEDMSVTAISGTSSPQTFTVTRSVNGVVRAHSAGAKVRLTQGAVFD